MPQENQSHLCDKMEGLTQYIDSIKARNVTLKVICKVPKQCMLSVLHFHIIHSALYFHWVQSDGHVQNKNMWNNSTSGAVGYHSQLVAGENLTMGCNHNIDHNQVETFTHPGNKMKMILTKMNRN